LRYREGELVTAVLDPPGISAEATGDISSVDFTLAPYGALLLRLVLGIGWIAHALLKIFRGMHTHADLLARNSIDPLLAWPTFGVELAGGLAIFLGFYSRQFALALVVFLGVVVWIKWPVGWLYSNTGGGWEYPLFWLFAQVSFVLTGDGALALRKAPLLPRRPFASRNP
jgi:putative oxidoreductase